LVYEQTLNRQQATNQRLISEIVTIFEALFSVTIQ